MEDQGQVTLDASLIGGPDPETSICPTASGFGAMVADRSSYELDPSFLAMLSDTKDLDYDRHTHTCVRTTPEPEGKQHRLLQYIASYSITGRTAWGMGIPFCAQNRTPSNSSMFVAGSCT